MPQADPQNGPGPTDAETGPMLEGWTTIAAIAALIPDVRIGLMVGGNTYRHPAVVAKMAVTVDHISNGRAVIGIGAGWQLNEHQRYGIELGSVGQRSDKLEEACQVIRAMLTGGRVNYDGTHYQLVDAPAEPAPIQSPLPLLVGGRGEQRTLRTVARWANEWNAWGAPADMAHSRNVLARHCDTANRDLNDIYVTAAAVLRICETTDESATIRATMAHRGGLIGTIDELKTAVEAYNQTGVDELVIPDFAIPPKHRLDTYNRFDNEVLAHFR